MKDVMLYQPIRMIYYILIFLFISCNQLLVYTKQSSSIQIAHLIQLPSYFISVEEILPIKLHNNAVFITITTYGYKEFTKELYQISNLEAYNNFFVVTHESASYRVIIYHVPLICSTSNIQIFQ